MKLRFLPALLATAILTACDPVYGPGLMNRASHPVRFAATFSGEPTEVELQLGQNFLHRHPNRKLEALTITDGPEKKEFTAAEIAAALFEAGPKGLVEIEYLGGGRIRGTSTKP